MALRLTKKFPTEKIMLIVHGRVARILSQVVDYVHFYAVVTCTVICATNEEEKTLVFWRAAQMPPANVG